MFDRPYFDHAQLDFPEKNSPDTESTEILYLRLRPATNLYLMDLLPLASNKFNELPAELSAPIQIGFFIFKDEPADSASVVLGLSDTPDKAGVRVEQIKITKLTALGRDIWKKRVTAEAKK